MNRHEPLDAQSALACLREGNRRFIHNVRSVDSTLSHSARQGLLEAQRPIAVVLCCSDSRAPAELVFDQGLGDLFVVRVAGNVVDAVVVGSVEFAVERLGTSLLVVMGHSHSGVVAATLDDALLSQREREAPVGRRRSIGGNEIIDFVRPAVERALRDGSREDRATLLAEATRSNVRAAVDHLRRAGSIEESARERRLTIVGAEYSLETGLVDFFDDGQR